MRRLIPAGLVLAMLMALLFAVGASSEPVDGIRVPTVEQFNDLDARVTDLENRPTPTVTATATVTVTETVTPTPSPTPTPTPTETTPPPDPEPAKKIIGMSSPAADWDLRLSQVGPTGIKARRIFGDLISTGRSQSTLIEQAIRDGMIPVVSYKGTATTASVAPTAAYLKSLNTTVLAVFHHEPHGDMTPASFVAQSRIFLDGVQSADVKIGPFLNGWLLDRRVADFKSYTDASLLRDWDFMGIDTYEEGTIDAPGDTKPGDRIPLLAQFLQDNGHPDKTVVIGEYNGYSGASIAAAGEAMLSMPNLWIACMWNATTGKGHVLTGERLDAFKATKADPRVLK